MSTHSTRLAQQIQFVLELDKLKLILRQTSLLDASRRENSAEHSWHLAVMALILAEYADPAIDLLHALKLVLVHDVVEIDAGDTFAFDAQANGSKAEREQAAAARIYGLLPREQADELQSLWEEFETNHTLEARFANALDRFEPLLQNAHSQGGTWKKFSITRAAVLHRMSPIRAGMPALWPYVLSVIEEACAAGYIANDIE